MLGVLGDLKSSLFKANSVNIDNNVCKLHYKATVVLLLAFSLLVTSKQYIGDPIACATDSKVPTEVLNQYCWITSTFTLPKAFEKQIGEEIPHPGIDKHTSKDERVYHQYYQWVCFVLFLQAAMFYVPHYLWKIWEGGKINSLIADLRLPILSDKEKTKKCELLAKYMSANINSNSMYFVKFVICEILNMGNVVGQIYFTNIFLGGKFSSFGADVIVEPQMLVRVFPRVTKCTFHLFGSSGDVQKHDALCVLPVNIINEKIYIFLWFWLIILSVVTGLSLIYRFVIISVKSSRFFLLKSHSRVLHEHSEIEVIFRKCNIGDWFLLYQMSKNMEHSTYVAFLSCLGKNLNEKVRQTNLLEITKFDRKSLV